MGQEDPRTETQDPRTRVEDERYNNQWRQNVCPPAVGPLVGGVSDPTPPLRHNHVSGLAYILNCSEYLVLLTRVCGNCWVGTMSFRYYYIGELYVLCFLFFGQVRC